MIHKTSRRSFNAGLALLALAGGTFLAPRAGVAQDAVTLARTVKKGDVTRGKLEVKASVGGQDVLVTGTTIETVKDVLANGNVVVEMKDENTKLSVGGMEMDQPAGPPMTVTRTKYGKLLDLKRDGGDEAFITLDVQRAMTAVSDILFPEKAVKNGDSWTTELDNPVVKEQKITVKTTYLGTEKVGDVAYWKVKQVGEAVIDANGTKLGADGTFWLDPTNGEVFKQEAAVSNIPTQFGPISWTIKLERVK